MPFCPTHSLTTLLLDLQVPIMRKQEEGVIVICFISPVADNDIRIRVYQDNLSGTSFLDGECLSLQLSLPLLLPLLLTLAAGLAVRLAAAWADHWAAVLNRKNRGTVKTVDFTVL